MYLHIDLNPSKLFQALKRQSILYAGHGRLKIFGRLHCKSGKRMNKQNRIFFTTQAEAIQLGFRPCSHCMQGSYRQWKARQKKAISLPPV